MINYAEILVYWLDTECSGGSARGGAHGALFVLSVFCCAVTVMNRPDGSTMQSINGNRLGTGLQSFQMPQRLEPYIRCAAAAACWQ